MKRLVLTAIVAAVLSTGCSPQPQTQGNGVVMQQDHSDLYYWMMYSMWLQPQPYVRYHVIYMPPRTTVIVGGQRYTDQTYRSSTVYRSTPYTPPSARTTGGFAKPVQSGITHDLYGQSSTPRSSGGFARPTAPPPSTRSSGGFSRPSTPSRSSGGFSRSRR